MRTAFITFVVMVTGLCAAQDFVAETERVFTPGERPEIAIHQSAAAQEYELTMWRVKDPIGFCAAQKDLMRPEIEGTPLRKELDAAIAASDAAIKPKVYDAAARGATGFVYVGTCRVTLSEEEKSTGDSGGDESGWRRHVVSLGVSEKGLYLVEVRSGVRAAYVTVCVSEICLVLKRTEREALAQVAKRSDGEPVPQAKVTVYDGGKKTGEWVTGQRGTALIEFQRYRPRLRVFAAAGDDFAASESYHYPVAVKGMRCYLYTERPVYRPGERAHFRAIARRVDGEHLRVVPNAPVRWEVTDARRRKVAEGAGVTSRFGTFHGSFDLKKGVSLGRCHLTLRIGGKSFRCEFHVETYRKPDFRVTAASDRPHYVQGKSVRLDLRATYLFGGPVTSGKVRVAVKRSRFSMDPFARERNQFLSAKEMEFLKEETVATAEGKLTAEGAFSKEFATERLPYDYALRFEVHVTDETTHRTVSTSTTALLTTSGIRLGIMTDSHLYNTGEALKARVRVVSFEGEVSDVEVEIAARAADGQVLHAERVKTDARGEATLIFKAERPGRLILSASATDHDGNPATASQGVWVIDKKSPQLVYDGDWLELVTDKDTYMPGETVYALIVAPTAPTWRLVTVEGAKLYDAHVQEIKGHAQLFTFRVTESMMPNVYVSVSMVYGNRLLTAEKMVMVPPAAKRINIKSVWNKKEYRPREEATISVEATDASGKPVKCELSAGVVDEGLYLVRPERTPEIVTFFWPRTGNGVSTTRRLDAPSVSEGLRSERLAAVLGEAGKKMKGHGVDSAVDEEAPRRFRRGLGYSGMPSPGSGGPRIVEEALVEKPVNLLSRGARSKESSAGEEVSVWRRNFATTAFWAPVVETDENGRATIKFTLPDNLTTWRLTLRAADVGDRFGGARATAVSNLPVMVRTVWPRFLRLGDRVTLAAVAHNRTEKALPLQVVLDADNLKGAGLTMMREVPAGGHLRLPGEYKAEKIGEAKVRVKVHSERGTDAMEVKLPVIAGGVRRAASGGGLLKKGTSAWHFSIPSDAADARLEVHVAPNLHAAVTQALRYLVDYPYGCVEQTMSRFLPAVVAAHAYQRLQVKMGGLEKKLPSVLKAGVARLRDYQHADGGWGWWKDDATDAFMTAYVVMGLSLAREADVKVDGEVLKRGVAALKAMVEKGVGDYNREAYCIWALSTAGHDVSALVDRVFDDKRRKEADAYTKALVVMALERCGRSDDAKLTARELLSAASEDGATLYWGDERAVHRSSDAVETTAYVVWALTRAEGGGDKADKAVGWLLSRRCGGRWKSTRDTAAAVLALVAHAGAALKETKVNLSVRLNGNRVAQMTDRDVREAGSFSVALTEGLKAGGNVLEVVLDDGPAVWWSAGLTYTSRQRPVPPENNGFEVGRVYRQIRLVTGKKGFETTVEFVGDGIVETGEIVTVEVVVKTEEDREYVVVADPLPAGLEFDRRTTLSLFGPVPKHVHREAWDDKVVFFLRRMKAGVHRFRYAARAAVRGTYRTPPAYAELMYFPAVRGHGKDTIVGVR